MWVERIIKDNSQDFLLEQLSGGVFTEMGKTAEKQVFGEENKNSSLSFRYQLDTPVKVSKRQSEMRDLRAAELDLELLNIDISSYVIDCNYI